MIEVFEMLELDFDDYITQVNKKFFIFIFRINKANFKIQK